LTFPSIRFNGIFINGNWTVIMKVDDINIRIIQHLRDGRKSFKKIAEDLQLTENTVRARVKKLCDEGVLEITGLVDPSSIAHHQMMIMGVKLNSTDLFAGGEAFSRLRGVVRVSVVTGRYDLMVEVLFNDSFGLPEFYNEEVPRVSGVLSLETFVVYKGYNVKVPYIL